MTFSRFFFAGILCAKPVGRTWRCRRRRAIKWPLVKESSIIFAGTVSQLGATSFAGVPKSAQNDCRSR